MAEPTQNNQPEAVVKDRDIRIAIWKNPTKGDQGVRFSASLPERNYEVNGTWKKATSFNQDEYLRIQRLSGLVVNKIAELYAAQNA